MRFLACSSPRSMRFARSTSWAPVSRRHAADVLQEQLQRVGRHLARRQVEDDLLLDAADHHVDLERLERAVEVVDLVGVEIERVERADDLVLGDGAGLADALDQGPGLVAAEQLDVGFEDPVVVGHLLANHASHLPLALASRSIRPVSVRRKAILCGSALFRLEELGQAGRAAYPAPRSQPGGTRPAPSPAGRSTAASSPGGSGATDRPRGRAPAARRCRTPWPGRPCRSRPAPARPATRCWSGRPSAPGRRPAAPPAAGRRPAAPRRTAAGPSRRSGASSARGLQRLQRRALGRVVGGHEQRVAGLHGRMQQVVGLDAVERLRGGVADGAQRCGGLAAAGRPTAARRPARTARTARSARAARARETVASGDFGL